MSIYKKWSYYYITWNPKKEQVGEYKVTVVLTDKFSGSIEKDITFKVVENQPPYIKVDDHPIKKEFRKNKRKYQNPLSLELRNQLSDYFKPYNEELEELLEMKFNWD